MAKKTKKSSGGEKSASNGASPIDTGLAAQSVAKSLLTKARMHGPAELATGQKESGAFKQMKDGLKAHPSKLAANSLNSILGPSRSELPNRDRKTAHSQTQGNVARVNIPRRTAG